MKGGLLISLMRAKRDEEEEDDASEDSGDSAEEERAARDVRSALESGDDAKLARALRYFIEHCSG